MLVYGVEKATPATEFASLMTDPSARKDPVMRNMSKIRNLAVSGLMLFGITILGVTKSAAQDVLTPGQRLTVSGTVLCDTQEQLERVAAAQQESFMAAMALISTMSLERNALNEWPCVVLTRPTWVTVVIDTGFVENLKFRDGVDRSFYIVAVMWEHNVHGPQPGFIFSPRPVDETGKPAEIKGSDA